MRTRKSSNKFTNPQSEPLISTTWVPTSLLSKAGYKYKKRPMRKMSMRTHSESCVNSALQKPLILLSSKTVS